MMWQNLTLAYLAGWASSHWSRIVRRRMRSGASITEALTDKQERNRRRIPRPSEVP